MEFTNIPGIFDGKLCFFPYGLPNTLNLLGHMFFLFTDEPVCGVPLQSLQETDLHLVNVSSVADDQPGVTVNGIQLFEYQAWCAAPNDEEPFILVRTSFINHANDTMSPITISHPISNCISWPLGDNYVLVPYLSIMLFIDKCSQHS